VDTGRPAIVSADAHVLVIQMNLHKRYPEFSQEFVDINQEGATTNHFSHLYIVHLYILGSLEIV
jgi:hypothetical protein